MRGMFDGECVLCYRFRISYKKYWDYFELIPLGASVRRLGVLLLGGGLFVSGCGPIVSGVQIIKADVELSAAATAGAKNNAPYEYTAATEYLQKAREEHGYSDFAESRKYANKAFELAEKARKKAESIAKREAVSAQ